MEPTTEQTVPESTQGYSPTYLIKEYALISFVLEAETYSEVMLVESSESLPSKLKSLVEAYGVTEFKVDRKYTVTPDGSEEAPQRVGVAVEGE